MFGASAATARFMQAVQQKTGLVAQGDHLAGTFQGLPAYAKTEMVTNLASAVRGGGGALGGFGALLGGNLGGMATAMTGGDFHMRHLFMVELPGSNLPGASIRESTTLWHDKNWQGQRAIGRRVRCGVPWIDAKFEVCSTHEGFMAYVCASQEFQPHLHHWHFTNIAWNGSRISVEILDSGTRIASAFGTEALQNGDLIRQGLALAAAAARATYAR